jgi:carbonic anhydrase/acetyltransferase-like protein (isoleucine patch superfamily)
MSFNQLIADQPQPEIAGSAVILGEVHVGAGAILAQGLIVRSHGAAVSIGNYSAILENGVVIGTREHPVRVGQRTVFGHRATIVGATIGDLCEIGNGAILMPGSRLGSGCILGEGTLVPPDTVIPADSVLVGRPPHVIRSVTDADRERLAVLRQHQTNLTDHPGTIVHGPMRAGEHMGTLYAYRDKTPSIGAGAIVCDSSVVGAESVVRAGACVKQRARLGDRSILDGFPARLAGTLTGPPPMPGWALPPDAVATLRRVQR